MCSERGGRRPRHGPSRWVSSQRPAVHRFGTLGHWQTTTFVAGLRCQRLTADAHRRANGRRGPLAYIQNFLCPTLPRGDIVVLDNLGSHKVEGIRETVEAVSATLPYLPPLLPRSETYREALPETQSSAPQSRGRQYRRPLDGNRKARRMLSTTVCDNYFSSSGYVRFFNQKCLSLSAVWREI